MVRAVRRAAADAGSETLLADIESISVPQGMWEYRNPGRLIADALGCPLPPLQSLPGAEAVAADPPT